MTARGRAEQQDDAPRVSRFTVTERALHWAFAAAYLALLVSGLPLMLPALRELIRDYTPAIGVRLHLAAAVLWVLAPLAVVVLGDRRALVRASRQLASFTRADLRWLASFPRWLVTDAETRARLDREVGRFNAAQKLNSLFVSASSALLLVSGLALIPAALAGTSEPGGAWHVLHRYLTLVALAPLAGHVYLAAVHPPTRPSLSGIVDGHVDARWAARHHPRGAAPPREDA